MRGLNKNKMQLQDAEHTNNKKTHKDIGTDIGLLGWFSEKKNKHVKRRDTDSPKIIQKNMKESEKKQLKAISAISIHFQRCLAISSYFQPSSHF